jgi:hypothetical protein
MGQIDEVLQQVGDGMITLSPPEIGVHAEISAVLGFLTSHRPPSMFRAALKGRETGSSAPCAGGRHNDE